MDVMDVTDLYTVAVADFVPFRHPFELSADGTVLRGWICGKNEGFRKEMGGTDACFFISGMLAGSAKTKPPRSAEALGSRKTGR
ncbi:MAG: hypothetical protein BGO99_00500 [Nitrosospira sp. 56-18]|jgi:hypothetical protein|nr:MAG: hypothetical protein BGO99_00500 [Nitrosospira sp. 56-18]